MGECRWEGELWTCDEDEDEDDGRLSMEIGMVYGDSISNTRRKRLRQREERLAISLKRRQTSMR